jgi:hypothetical protein
MLIGFIGLPNSGKTTIASKVFSHLKENASHAELLVEQARYYIAEWRVKNKLPFSNPLSLLDESQLEIAKKQKLIERTMVEGSDPKCYILTDSSVQNSSIYVTDELFNNSDYRKAILNDSLRYDLMFYCHPFELERFVEDSNRIHSHDQILSLRKRADSLLDLLKENGTKVSEIMGTFSLENRFKTCLYTLTEEYMKYCSKYNND